MSEAGLDQLVKGSPPPNVSLPSVAAAAASSTDRPSSRLPSPSPSDPTSLLPSSPPQIYLNLLILEASLRAQYLTLRARRRQHTFILTIMILWIAYFFYGQFLRPREDGKGMGGSVYWLVDMLEKIALIGGLVMGVLFRLTGQWERGVKWPSKWLRTTNRGLRGMNCKIVVLKGPWWRELVSHFGFLLPVSWFVETPGSNYQYIDYANSTHGHSHERRPSAQLASKLGRREKHSHHELAEEDIAPGGDYIKILLLPKHFTPEFRENWEMYRAEYWDVENLRRAELRQKMRSQTRARAKQSSPWFWWVPWPLGPQAPSAPMRIPLGKHESGLISGTSVGPHVPSRTSSQKQQAKRNSIIKSERSILGDGREVNHSRSSSRSSVSQSPDLIAREFGIDADRERRLSTSSAGTTITGDQRRRRKVGTQDLEKRSSQVGPSRVKLAASTSGSRPGTPTDVGGLGLRSKASNLSAKSSGSEEGSVAARDSPRRRVVKSEPVD